MATVQPFPAVRPRPELAARICELPYDVVSSAQARTLAAGNPYSFFRISKPEIEWAEPIDPQDPRVYARGQANFGEAVRQGWLGPDPAPCFYLYQLSQGGHRQTGVVGVVSCHDYLQGVVRPHESTRPDKVQDRFRHIEALQAQTGPAFLVYRAQPELEGLISRRLAEPPAVDFTAADSVRHTVWVVSNPAEVAAIQQAFECVPRLYIADGHHRTEAAVRLFQRRNGAGGSAYFLAVLFPHNQVQILPYHRLVRDLNGLNPEKLLERLGLVCEVQPNCPPTPTGPNAVGLYVAGRWYGLGFRSHLTADARQADRLATALLQRHVLAPVFGIEDPRTSDRIEFVGGPQGTAELERRVNRGEFACAFALPPTHIEELMAVAEAGERMPPKSTWFEPKLRDGLFSYLI